MGPPWQEPHWSRELRDPGRGGTGQYVGCDLNIERDLRTRPNNWYGEGDDMIFIDGETWPPRLHGTGTEDYFNTAFCPERGVRGPYHGITLASSVQEPCGAARTRCTASTSRTRCASRSPSA